MKREYSLKFNITFNVTDLRDKNNRIVLIFFHNQVPFMSTYIDTETLNIHGFAYIEQEIPEATLGLVKEITNKVKGIVVLEIFEPL